LVNGVTGGGGEDLEETGVGAIEDTILNFAKSNPEMVKKFLDGIQSGTGETQQEVVR